MKHEPTSLGGRRGFLGAAAATLAGASAGLATSPAHATQPAGGTARTYVLVHGAWHGGWCWRRVTDRLRAEGHRVFTPTQTGLGERSHLISRQVTIDTFVQDIVNVIEWEELQDVILVGHSFAGVTITGVADRLPGRIRHLVYLDSLLIEGGRSPFDGLPPGAADARRKLAQDSSGGISLPVPDPAAFGVTEADDVAWLKARCTPHPLSTWESPLMLRNPRVGNGRPATYVAVLPHYPTLGAARDFARKQAGWTYVEMAAGHDAMLTSPDALTRLLTAL